MYNGGKNGAGTYQNIINKIPPHSTYVELFLGSGAILNNKRPALANYGVEIDPAVIDRFDYFHFAFIQNMDAMDWIRKNEKLLANPDTFIYVDPPYPMDSRKSQRPLYGYEMTDDQHRDLLQLLLSIGSMVAISTYQNPLYSEMLVGWNCYSFQSITRKGLATELLYMNYPDPTELHEYTYLGEDFIERQRIKRKIQREINKLKRLPILERNAILSAISDSQNRLGGISQSEMTIGDRS